MWNLLIVSRARAVQEKQKILHFTLRFIWRHFKLQSVEIKGTLIQVAKVYKEPEESPLLHRFMSLGR